MKETFSKIFLTVFVYLKKIKGKAAGSITNIGVIGMRNDCLEKNC